jgi:hypothetical protein
MSERMELYWQGEAKAFERTYTDTNVSTDSHTWIGLGSKSDFRGDCPEPEWNPCYLASIFHLQNRVLIATCFKNEIKTYWTNTAFIWSTQEHHHTIWQKIKEINV